MGWSSESMAARYQHVTDAMRSQVARQVGELTWNLPTGPRDRAVVTVPGDSLAVVLAVAEKCIASHRGRAQQKRGGAGCSRRAAGGPSRCGGALRNSK